jgi:hypothetical protein
MANMNMEDPAKQEQIRRGHHEYIPTVGKHGAYVPRQYKHQEYPKMMGKWPKPELKNFLKSENGVIVSQAIATENWQMAVKEWDETMSASVVNNAAEEKQWLRENAS